MDVVLLISILDKNKMEANDTVVYTIPSVVVSSSHSVVVSGAVVVAASVVVAATVVVATSFTKFQIMFISFNSYLNYENYLQTESCIT